MSLQSYESNRPSRKGRGMKPPRLWKKQTYNPLGRRTTLYLGALRPHEAETISRHIDHLRNAYVNGLRIDEETKAWLAIADKKLTAKLTEWGYCPPQSDPTVAEFCARFIEQKRSTAKPQTVFLVQQVVDQINEFFPEGKRLRDVTPTDAKDHAHWLRATKELGENTARRRLGRVREIFNAAIEERLISHNPFALRSIPVAVGAGVKRFVPAADIALVIEQCADPEWKLLFAFARYVGVRIPSEIRGMLIDDVNWSQRTILIRSPKTEGVGKAQRVVPIFPSVEKLLLDQIEALEDGEVHLFPRLRSHTNLATTAAKMVNRAGLATWPKFWNALRASCETELMDTFGVRRACQWLGNSPTVAQKNYNLIREDAYRDAGGKSGAESDAASVSLRTPGGSLNEKTPENSGVMKIEATRHGSKLLSELQAFLYPENESDAVFNASNGQVWSLIRAWLRADEEAVNALVVFATKDGSVIASQMIEPRERRYKIDSDI